MFISSTVAQSIAQVTRYFTAFYCYSLHAAQHVQVADRSRIAGVRSASHWCEVMTLRAADLCPWRRSDYWSPLVSLNYTNA